VRLDEADAARVKEALTKSAGILRIAAERKKLEGRPVGDSYPVLNPAKPEAAAAVIESSKLWREKFGGKPVPIVPYSDTRRGAPNGFELGGQAHVNVGRTSTNVASTSIHEWHHVVQRIAEAEAARGDADTPAIRYVNSVDSLFSDISEEGKANYVANFLHKGELQSIYDGVIKEGKTPEQAKAARDQAMQGFLKSDTLRKEMMADFMGNRATDKGFLHSLAKADPKGFTKFVKGWISILDNLITNIGAITRMLQRHLLAQYLNFLP
jgi:hypothetical protein